MTWLQLCTAHSPQTLRELPLRLAFSFRRSMTPTQAKQTKLPLVLALNRLRGRQGPGDRRRQETGNRVRSDLIRAAGGGYSVEQWGRGACGSKIAWA